MTGAAHQRSGKPPAGCVRLTRWWMAAERATTGRDLRLSDNVLAGLALPTSFDLDTFCRAVQHVRGRRLVITILPGRRSPARSMWCPGEHADHILVTPGWPRLYRDHLVLHGIGHMIFGHTGAPAVTHLVDDVLGDLDTGMLRRLRRTVYTAREEFQAEIFATRVQQRTGRWQAADSGDSGQDRPPSSSLLAALSSVLEHQPPRGTDTTRREPHSRPAAEDTEQHTRRDASVEG